MTFSTKAMAITGCSTLVVGFLLGFIPEHLSIDAVTHHDEGVQAQLTTSRRDEDISNFTVRAAMISNASAQRNFSIASNSASSFFTDLRQYTDQLPDSSLKQQLGTALTSRDAIIGGLAKADPAVTDKLQTLFLQMQKIQVSVLAAT